MTTYYTRDKLKMININIENHCKAAQFTNVETTNVKRDVRYFGVDLFTVDGKLLNQLHYNSDIKMLHFTPKGKSKGKYMEDFIKIFNIGITCNDSNYLLSENSEFYLTPFRYGFIIILDKINNLSTVKRCFNMDGKLLTKVKDTLNPNGELNREGLEYTAVYKDTDITKIERNNSKSSSISNISNYSVSNIPMNYPISTHNIDKVLSQNIVKEQSQATISVDKKHQDLQQTTVRSITIPEDSKVSISKSQTEDHKGYSDTSTSQSEKHQMKDIELSQKKSKSNIHILANTLYKLGIRTPKLLYVMWKKILKIGITLFVWQLIKQRWPKLMFNLLNRFIYFILGLLEASFLGWFINNSENWTIPSMEIQLPRWVSNTVQLAMENQLPCLDSNTAQSAIVPLAEINLENLPETNPINLEEIIPKSIPGFELYREINPKTLPELKVFTDNVDTGRELYKGLEGQESNLPIILFGVVVIAVIIYIGWKQELFNDLIPKSGLFSFFLPGRKNSSSRPNIRDSVESTKEYDVEFIKKFIEDGKHTLDPVPFTESDLAFSKIVCPSTGRGKKVKFEQTSDEIATDVESDYFAEYKQRADDKVAEYKRIAQTSEKLLRDKTSEFDQFVKINDEITSNQISESTRTSNMKISEYKLMAQEASDKVAQFKRMSHVAELKRMAQESNSKRLAQEALEAHNKILSDKIAEYDQIIQTIQTNDKILRDRIAEYEEIIQTKNTILESEQLVHHRLLSHMKDVLDKKGHQWSPDILKDLISSKLIKPPVTSTSGDITSGDITSVTEISKTSNVYLESPGRSPIHETYEYSISPSERSVQSERSVPSVYNPTRSESPRSLVHSLPEREYPRSPIKLLTKSVETHVPSTPYSSPSNSPRSDITSILEPGRVNIPVRLDERFDVQLDEPRSPIHLRTRTDLQPDSPSTSILEPGRVHIPERLDEHRIHIPDRIEEPRSPIRSKWFSTSTSDTTSDTTYKTTDDTHTYKSISTSTSDLTHDSTSELIDAIRADLIKLKGESAVYTENLGSIVDDLDTNIEFLADICSNWW